MGGGVEARQDEGADLGQQLFARQRFACPFPFGGVRLGGCVGLGLRSGVDNRFVQLTQLPGSPCNKPYHKPANAARPSPAPVLGSLMRARQAHSTVSSSGGTPLALIVSWMRP